MIISALDTGMRQSEMLALRFKDVDLARGLITLRGETTKSRREEAADALVFSDESGEPVGRFRTGWVTAVLKRTTGGTSTPQG